MDFESSSSPSNLDEGKAEDELKWMDDDADEDADCVLYKQEMMNRSAVAAARSAQGETYSGATASEFEWELLDFEQKYVKNRLSSKISVPKFWKDMSCTFPLLYDVALIALAVPGTQVLVERLCSALKFILSDHREKLSLRESSRRSYHS